MIRASADGKNLDDPKVKTWIVDRVTPLINDIGSSVERAHYRQRLARLLKIPEAALFSKVDTSKTYRPEKLPSSSLEKAAVDRPHILASPTASREEFCLAALIRQPRLIYQINRIFAEALPDASQYLSEEEQAAIDPGVLRYGLAQQVLLDDFLQPEHRAIFDIWSQALDQQDDDPVAYLIEHSEGPPREVVESWLSQPLYGLRRTVKAVENEISVDRINEAVMQALIDLRIKRIEDQCHQLVLLMQDMDNGGDKSVAMLYSHSITLLLAAKRQLSQARFDHSLVGKARSADHPSGPTQAAYR
jgi:DNA primase